MAKAGHTNSQGNNLIQHSKTYILGADCGKASRVWLLCQSKQDVSSPIICSTVHTLPVLSFSDAMPHWLVAMVLSCVTHSILLEIRKPHAALKNCLFMQSYNPRENSSCHYLYTDYFRILEIQVFTRVHPEDRLINSTLLFPGSVVPFIFSSMPPWKCKWYFRTEHLCHCRMCGKQNRTQRAVELEVL